MCKDKEVDDTIDHLHYPALIREAARLLGYGDRVAMGALLGASVATGLSTFGRQNAYELVRTGCCTASDARAAQKALVEYATRAETRAFRALMGGWPGVEKELDELSPTE